MSWNIEIALIEAEPDDVDNCLPDVFGSTGEIVGFEDASSVNMGRKLAASTVDQYVVIIDTRCRLTPNSHLFDGEVKRSGLVVRIADHPIQQQFKNGIKVGETSGAAELGAEIGLAKDQTSDGEDVARAAMQKNAGIDFPFGLFDLKFHIYDLD